MMRSIGGFGAPRQISTGFASWLRYCTATSLNWGQPNFARCLVVSWAGTVYIHFRGLLPLTEFCQVQNSLWVQVLRSLILAALLHSTRAVGASQTLLLGTRKGIAELSLLVCATYIFRRAAFKLDIGPHSSSICSFSHRSEIDGTQTSFWHSQHNSRPTWHFPSCWLRLCFGLNVL